MLRRGAPLPTSWLRRCLSTSATARRPKALSLTPYVSPLLLRLHPDKLQRQSPTLAQANEQALKQLNVFLELATLGCNNDAYNARKQILALADTRDDGADSPLLFPLLFHTPGPPNGAEQDAGQQDFVEVKHIVQVPGRLVKRTLSNPGRSSTDRTDPQAALRAPFARDWQRTTKRILQDLFEVAHVPLGQTGDEKTTALAEWIAEGDTVEDQADMHGVRAGERNRQVKKQHEQFDKFFHSLLTREKNIVQEFTTGLEDGPTTQHAILTSLLHSRLFLPKFTDPHMKKSAFHWVANLLLVNFMELRLHSLVWNKITLLVTADEDVTDPQASWDENSPEEGMGILIPIGMDVDTLIDFIYEHVEELEMALEEKSAHDQAAFKKEHQRQRREKQKKKGTQSRRRRQHFYADEVNAIFGKR
ncbi:hypothetical protein PHYBOEH_007153 [Phytophthora boehmeriae]|uniref:DUF4460 domain-containing protein n=1 Tax=Phytophthora boehmeriae TaxID=109152 RepID=A0A8T1WCU9_9STRA|nr:hypothetical protein PHYBOEH_007153 [Phytophthora boehmeriae]